MEEKYLLEVKLQLITCDQAKKLSPKYGHCFLFWPHFNQNNSRKVLYFPFLNVFIRKPIVFATKWLQITVEIVPFLPTGIFFTQMSAKADPKLEAWLTWHWMFPNSETVSEFGNVPEFSTFPNWYSKLKV